MSNRRFLVVTGIALGCVLVLLALAYITSEESPEDGGGNDTEPATYEPRLREAAVAGTFYANDSTRLREAVRAYLAEAEAASDVQGTIGGLLVPHAGYVYSGQVAAWAYKQVEGRGGLTVILVGPSHYHDVQNASVFPCGWYRTPLGDVEVDAELAISLIESSPEIEYDPKAHDREHSLEVQLPFLQEVLSDFKIVPMTINQYDPNLWASVAQTIATSTQGKDVLLIASSDLSHYHPRSTASVLDQRVVTSVDAFDPVGLQLKARSRACELCGLAAVEVVMMACQKMGYDASKILAYGDSADASGDTSAVVGYLSAAFHRAASSVDEVAGLDVESKEELVRLARSSIEHYLRTGDRLSYSTSNPLLLPLGGAFVTLKKDGNLRGCIGHTLPDGPLWYAVAEASVEAACHDPRFTPLTLEELDEVEIEVSVLSRLRMVLDPEEIEVGRDGLYILGYGRSGLLLPQVATENGWDRDRLLNEICLKAGIPLDAWKSSELYAFTAQVFGE